MAKKVKPAAQIKIRFSRSPNAAMDAPAIVSERARAFTYPLRMPRTPRNRLETNMPLAQMVSLIPSVALSEKARIMGSANI